MLFTPRVVSELMSLSESRHPIEGVHRFNQLKRPDLEIHVRREFPGFIEDKLRGFETEEGWEARWATFLARKLQKLKVHVQKRKSSVLQTLRVTLTQRSLFLTVCSSQSVPLLTVCFSLSAPHRLLLCSSAPHGDPLGHL
jgi:hypothetical protein